MSAYTDIQTAGSEQPKAKARSAKQARVPRQCWSVGLPAMTGRKQSITCRCRDHDTNPPGL